IIYDVIIIGGGPAGCAAAVYAARKRLKTILITESFGGQSIVSGDIQNWIGEAHISGFDLAKKFAAHVRAFSDVVEIKMPEKVISNAKTRKVLGIKLANGINTKRTKLERRKFWMSREYLLR